MDPLRSEADAFRVLLVVAAGAAVVIAITLLTNSLVGFCAGLLLAGIGAGRLVANRRAAAPEGRIAVVVDDVARSELIAELRDAHRGAEIRLAMLVPPGSAPAEREKARQRAEISVQRLQEAGLRARGEVLEADREDLAGGGPLPGLGADETVISLRPPHGP